MIKRTYKSCDFSIENNPDKNYLQRLLYSLSGIKGSATVVSGISVERHINDFDQIIWQGGATLNIVEIDLKIFTQIKYLLAKYLKENKKLNGYIKVHNCNVANAPINRFVDADLTKTADSSIPIFKTLFLRMHYMKEYKKTVPGKALICTYTTRKSNYDDISFLNEVTGFKWAKKNDVYNLPVYNVASGLHCNWYQYHSDKYIAHSFHYRFKNGSPMRSVLIKWK